MINYLYGLKISQGSISNFNRKFSENLEGFVNNLKEGLMKADIVFHSDETGCIADNILHWVHVYCTSKISGKFQNVDWLNVHASIRSYISTMAKRNRQVFDYLVKAHTDINFASKLGV